MLRSLADTAYGAAFRAKRAPLTARRLSIARRYLRGSGLEIGALHDPLRRLPGTRVRYVDRYDVDGLRRHYPELRRLALVDVDVVEDGETLASLADGSEDFVVANHFIEHTQDPLGVLAAHLRVLRPGGVLFMAVPDQRRTFDADRPLTDVDHLLGDHAGGAQAGREAHYREWAALVDKVAPGEVEAHARRLMEAAYSIHFHTWIPQTFVEMLAAGRRDLGLPVALEALRPNGIEFVCAMRKAD